MNCKVENGKFIVEINGKTYSFNAHGEEPRPSMLGMGLTVAGKHWSNRDENIKLEKHTSIQSGTINEKYLAWYTQEFIPDGVDYKINKNARIYLGDLETGEDRLIYKGECYGDLCFDGDDLYFNMGNKIAVINLESEEVTVLFKHSGRKKNNLGLRVTPKRIFFYHWTKNTNNLMWYDRETKELINPHIDSNIYYLLDENTAVYDSLYYVWCIDLNTLKKKHFFNKAKITAIRKQVCDFFEIPSEYYEKDFRVGFNDYKGNKLHFLCEGMFYMQNLSFDQKIETAFKMKLPNTITAQIVYDVNTGDMSFIKDKSDMEIRKYTQKNGIEVVHWVLRNYKPKR